MTKLPHNAADEGEEETQPSPVAQREEDVLAFWKERNVFEKTLNKESPEGEFVFYDGPPFATGLPHYGHLLAGTMKDIIPRYQTMRGKHVRRQWGWDCHGLPVENLVEKKLDLTTKKDILDYGIDAFNKEAEDSVLQYRDEWRSIIPRTGRWADMDNDYRTMDASYSETTWWIFKQLFDKGLIYEGFKSMHLCPRCETTLSNFEVNLGYADIKDLSVTAKLELNDEPGTFLLAWTTTPWTLPGNMAAGVHPDITYAKVSHEGAMYVVAKDTIERVFGEGDVSIQEEMPGKELVGLSYTPPFPYYRDQEFENKEHAWKVYAADYVTTDDGTGIVHLAPAFGEEDLELAQENSIPVIHHVGVDGRFVEAVTDFAGYKVKPKDEDGEEHMATDIEIVKWLAHHDLLFSKEKIEHSYPHCWRCDTPLLNYATTSWFIAVTQIKDKLLSENGSVRWTPKHIGTGRFGKWLEGARDWAVSRSRFWGSPLPVWRSEDGDEMEVIGSVGELRKKSRDQITEVVLMRHAESKKNTSDMLDSSLDTYDLTEKGEGEAQEAADKLKDVDIIYTSPVLRARRTAEILAKEINAEVRVADGVREIDSGEWDGKARDDETIIDERKAYHALSAEEQFDTKRGKTGESWYDLEKRAKGFVQQAVKDHGGQKILIVTHQAVITFLTRFIENRSLDEITYRLKKEHYGAFADPTAHAFFSASGEPFDFHRPYIDEIKAYSEQGTELTRVEEVFDTWYESGSMPYAQYHYPFENKDVFDPEEERGFPADFIAEGVDQTRGWFYSLLVLGVGLFDESPYKNVIVNGIIQAEDGQKMSKRLKNYPDPIDVINTYGADALRLYMIASPVVRAEELNFSEKGVAEVMRKVIVRLDNVRSFYELYRDTELEKGTYGSDHPLDAWIRSRLAETESTARNGLESYELDRASRPLFDFVDDLSTWYLRRSRDRLRADTEDAQHAKATLYTVLTTFAHILAPFAPFYAEHLFRALRHEDDPESVHLSKWPESREIDSDLTETMQRVRDLVSEGLEARSKEGIKVRQPLASLTYGGKKLDPAFEDMIRDEVNVKEVIYDEKREDVQIDTELTEELKREGVAREIMRGVQDLRKKQGLEPHERVILTIMTGEAGQHIVEQYQSDIAQTVSADRVETSDLPDTDEHETVDISGMSFAFRIERP